MMITKEYVLTDKSTVVTVKSKFLKRMKRAIKKSTAHRDQFFVKNVDLWILLLEYRYPRNTIA